MSHKLPTKIFSSFSRPLIDQPNLIEIQTKSYQWFLREGLRELFAEISPIKDYASKDLELYFVDYKFDITNKSLHELRLLEKAVRS